MPISNLKFQISNPLLILALLLTSSLQALPPAKEMPHIRKKVPIRKIAVKPGPGDYVVLVPGLLHGSFTHQTAARKLNQAGYHTIQIFYPSRSATITENVTNILLPALKQHCTDPNKRIHFMCHSLGSVMTRLALKKSQPKNLGHVIMLGPPNRGNRLIDLYANNKLGLSVLGPVTRELGTHPSSTPNQLGEITFPTLVIMGTKPGLSPFQSKLNSPNDGFVAVTDGRIDGITALETLPIDHLGMFRSKAVLDRTIVFFQTGK